MTLYAALAALDRSLTNSIPLVPGVVSSTLDGVRKNVRNGEDLVATSASFGDVVRHGYIELNAAYSEYGHAASLIGGACGSIFVYTGLRVARGRIPPNSPEILKEICRTYSNAC
jgi:hypothetical protein